MESADSTPPQRQLIRAIGRWSLVALVVNSIIGSGVFGLPSTVAALIGNFSPYAVLAAGAGMSVIIACFAEVASRFHQAGGPYLYARVAFGRLMGIQTAWMLWLGQVAAPAANANLFVIYLGEFFPHAKDPLPRAIILTVLVGLLTFINIRGVRAGAQVSNLFTAAKLLPLFAVIVLGLFVLQQHHWTIASPAVASPSTSQWLKAMLLLVFAYGGFETALAPMSEAKDPRRDAPFALFMALLACTVIYALIQWVVVGVLPDAAHSQRPLADVARLAVGPIGAALVAVGALISFYGYLSAKILAMPRVPFALAEQGDFPKVFATVHRRFHTPYVSILVFAAMVWGLALLGDFKWNVTLSAVARLLYYAVGCAALPILRRKNPEGAEAMFQLPAGNFFAVLGVILCVILVTRVDFGQSMILVGTIALAFVNWAVVGGRMAQSNFPLAGAAQNLQPAAIPADKGTRVAAYLIDVIPAFVLGLFGMIPVVGAIIAGLLLSPYWLLRDVGGASVGKILLGSKVALKNGQPAPVGARILRNVPLAVGPAFLIVPFLGYVLGPVISGIAVLVEGILVLTGGERLGDKIAGTTVIKK